MGPSLHTEPRTSLVFRKHLRLCSTACTSTYLSKKKEHGKLVFFLQKWLGTPLGLLPITVLFVAEALLLKPIPYELYAFTWHGFLLGLLAFLVGFCFVLTGSTCWTMLLRWRWMFLLVAATLFIYRLLQPRMMVPAYQTALESNFWIFTIFAFSYRYLNHAGKTLRYLSEAAYPVYILHMVFLYLASALIFPLALSPPAKFFLALGFTLFSCLFVYEFLIRRIQLLRPLFGLKRK